MQLLALSYRHFVAAKIVRILQSTVKLYSYHLPNVDQMPSEYYSIESKLCAEWVYSLVVEPQIIVTEHRKCCMGNEITDLKFVWQIAMQTNKIHFHSEMCQFIIGKFLQRFSIVSLIIVIFSAMIILADRNSDVTFQFPEYDYKETSKNVCK